MAEEATSSTEETETTAPAPKPHVTPKATGDVKMFTQAELDEQIEKRLNKQRAQYADYADLKKRAADADELQTKYQATLAERDEARNDFNAAVRDVTVLKIALDKGLPFDMVGRLKGDTEEALAKDADELLELIKPRGPRGFDGGARGSAPKAGENPNDLLRAAMRARR